MGEATVEWTLLLNRHHNHGYWSMSSVPKEDLKILSTCPVAAIPVWKKIPSSEANGHEAPWVSLSFDAARGEN